MKKKDIIIFLSDQHAEFCTGYSGEKVVRTPNLDKIAADGTVFDNAYTTCPLCIPARMSMLSGQLPSKTGVLDNEGSIPSDQSTFLHSLGAEGYETVLCGRMHFEGPDQRHGFTKRIFGDITSLYTGDFSSFKERKHYALTLTEIGCLQIIGGGNNSPTLEYDRQVINAALKYLKEDHEKPQCIVIGTYAPHFPYVAPVEEYKYYLDKVQYPKTLREGCNYDHPVLSGKLKDTSKDTVIKTRAAYFGMVEFVDRNVGLVYDAWNNYLKRNEKEGVFVYLSDHGDQVGERGLYGKKTFFESSVHIPMIFQGNGIKQGIRIKSPNSIMDLGITLCDLVGAEAPPEQDGKSLIPQLENGEEDFERVIFSEFVENSSDNQKVPGRMLRKHNWKYITYKGYEESDLLFDIKKDPYELENIKDRYKDVSVEMRRLITKDWDAEKILRNYKIRARHLKIQKQWIKNTEIDQSERWKTTMEALEYPEIMYKSDIELPEQIKNRIKNILQSEMM
ncbi:hypothetical protein LF65_03294 [Clostridium beijerinckii]|uniref:Sulfatase N-terminal domain-containing protein n=1 Tax=Clostridium beijerinckii TaxID=1520 RepID=A0A0B5QPC2_CLOBE|nr:sulfatase-like hydrolase/transferase [Clostridium beijerinckii]AJG99857.1 hypothetical protein LF65_03294 [Clostridium beijerinckii]